MPPTCSTSDAEPGAWQSFSPTTYTYRFLTDGVVLTSESTLRFRDREEIESTLAAEGYEVRDVREAPDRPGREWVFLARRTD